MVEKGEKWLTLSAQKRTIVRNFNYCLFICSHHYLCSPQIKSPLLSPWTKWTTSWLGTCALSRTGQSLSPSPSTTPASTSAMQTSPSTGILGMKVEPSYPESWLSLTRTLALAHLGLRWWSRQSFQIKHATHQYQIQPRPLVHLLIRAPQVRKHIFIGHNNNPCKVSPSLWITVARSCMNL